MSRSTATSSASRSACGASVPRCAIASRAAPRGVYGLLARATSQDSARRWSRASFRAVEPGYPPGMGGSDVALTAVRVLLVEDDRASAMVVEGQLLAMTTFRCEVQVAASLREARAALAGRAFDLVITDLHLPDSQAVETVEVLVGACPYPVIAITVDEDPA